VDSRIPATAWMSWIVVSNRCSRIWAAVRSLASRALSAVMTSTLQLHVVPQNRALPPCPVARCRSMGLMAEFSWLHVDIASARGLVTGYSGRRSRSGLDRCRLVPLDRDRLAIVE
jgi:hypothetical protein